ncbi:MAG: LysR substrate-binding domain-containing protein [Campylobacter sputorum]|uniref:LysR substrate-binding domain-containing protein n=1 Tax=Campylobacter sputorum TaxID=206 RepID=UPI000B778C6D|nr:LysR substrate-binding domain-containing protein [Campylobacter sputorum]ASM38080.1 transcriptional regulator, LysR family [Campylobacter sputorum bv. paraureolyticus LMG 11764]MDY6121227.1 LysR substrate-binding domain-containing protein [Campylobacter sputorum]
MTLKQLEYFFEVCKNGSITKSAQNVGISQSTLSLSIKDLEKSLNTPLFDRIGKNLILNEKGKLFYKESLPIVVELINVKNKTKYGNKIKINLHSSQNIGMYLLPKILLKFDKMATIDLKITNSEMIISNILNNTCDIGIIESSKYNSSLITKKICDDELVVITGDKNFSQKEFFIDEICNEKWILRENGSGLKYTFLANIPSGVNLNVIMQINNTKAIIELIRKERIFSCIPKFILENEAKNEIFEVKIKNIKFIRYLNLIYRKEKEKNSTFMNFCDELCNSLNNTHKS